MSALNLLVFREGRQHANGEQLKAALATQLKRLDSSDLHSALLGALLLAGELECGVADADPEAANAVEYLIDSIANALLESKPAFDIQSLRSAAEALPVFGDLKISLPEGFAYYALHPLAYANLDSIPAKALFIVGIRSIGTTLSAIMAAAGRLKELDTRRITVRPQGHPYNRSTEFLPKQLAAVKQAIAADATFAVVDEGPGLSGSSFLSVAEALERAGVPRENITLVSSHAPNVDALCADDAARRWNRYRGIAVGGEARRPSEAQIFVGGGEWRKRLFAHVSEWPATWTNFERLKYLSLSATNSGEPRLYKFAGFGHYGNRVFEREQAVATAGFGPLPQRETDGFVSYPWMDGRPMSASDLSEQVLDRLAQYCAFRSQGFPAQLSNLEPLQQMAEHNLRELGFDASISLRLERPVITDGRMQPHEWLMPKQSRMLKTDSGSHGDDHFFPGPTDIAWDLAGAVVEWQMNEQQTTEFLDRYRLASGDDASARIGGFIKAYAVFRLAYCLMAANAMCSSKEQARFEHSADFYRARLTTMDSRNMASASSLSAAS